MEILDKIIILLKEQNKKQKDLTDFLGITQNVFTDWKAGRIKSYTKYLPEIADFLGCSVDYLLDRDNFSNIEGNGNVVQQGQIHNSPVTIGGISSRCLTEQEQEILRIFNNLSVKEKAELFLKICDYEKNKQI